MRSPSWPASGRFDIASHTQDMHRDTWPRRGCLPNPGESAGAYAAALGTDLAAVDAKIEAATAPGPWPSPTPSASTATGPRSSWPSTAIN